MTQKEKIMDVFNSMEDLLCNGDLRDTYEVNRRLELYRNRMTKTLDRMVESGKNI